MKLEEKLRKAHKIREKERKKLDPRNEVDGKKVKKEKSATKGQSEKRKKVSNN